MGCGNRYRGLSQQHRTIRRKSVPRGPLGGVLQLAAPGGTEARPRNNMALCTDASSSTDRETGRINQRS
jgi:hypothetical protein